MNDTVLNDDPLMEFEVNKATPYLNLLSVIITTIYLYLSFISSDPKSFEIPFGILISIQLFFTVLFINTFTIEYLEDFTSYYKPSYLQKFIQYYGAFVVLLALFGLIDFWWYMVISIVVIGVSIVVKMILLLNKEHSK